MATLNMRLPAVAETEVCSVCSEHAPAPAPPMGGGMMGGMGAAPAGGMMGGMPPVGTGAQPMGGQMQMLGMGQRQQQMGGMQMGGMPQMGAPAPAPAPAGAFDFLA